jgi:uncharacterized protein (TIGR00288 family)
MEWLRGLVGSDPTGGVGVYLDGPNVFRDEFDADLDEIRELGESYGTVSVARVYLDEHATPGLVQAVEAHGFEVVITSGDVDVRLATDATVGVLDNSLETLLVVSRDTDFKPVLELAASRGLKTVAVAPGEYGRSDALRKAAHEALTLSR